MTACLAVSKDSSLSLTVEQVKVFTLQRLYGNYQQYWCCEDIYFLMSVILLLVQASSQLWKYSSWNRNNTDVLHCEDISYLMSMILLVVQANQPPPPGSSCLRWTATHPQTNCLTRWRRWFSPWLRWGRFFEMNNQCLRVLGETSELRSWWTHWNALFASTLLTLLLSTRWRGKDNSRSLKLQKTAFSLVKSRLALGSHGCLFVCRHHAENGPIHREMVVDCPLVISWSHPKWNHFTDLTRPGKMNEWSSQAFA